MSVSVLLFLSMETCASKCIFGACIYIQNCLSICDLGAAVMSGPAFVAFLSHTHLRLRALEARPPYKHSQTEQEPTAFGCISQSGPFCTHTWLKLPPTSRSCANRANGLRIRCRPRKTICADPTQDKNDFFSQHTMQALARGASLNSSMTVPAFLPYWMNQSAT